MADILIMLSNRFDDFGSDDDEGKAWENYQLRLRRGDFIEVRETGFFNLDDGTGAGYRKDIFIVLRLTDVTASQVINYLTRWVREIETSAVPEEHNPPYYVYQAEVIDGSVSGAALIDAKELLADLPDWVTVLERSTSYLKVQIYAEDAEDRADKVAKLQRSIRMLERLIRQSRYKLDVASIPTAVRTQILADGYYITTSTIALNYIVDKQNTTDGF